MIGTRVVVESKRLDFLLKKMIKEQPRKVKTALGKSASHGINIILDRNKKGEGLKGRFTPYSKEYAKYRRANNFQTSRVDLNVTGDMWAAMKVSKNTSREAVISFTSREEAKKAHGNHKIRPWFGLTRKERDSVRLVFKREFFQ